MIFCYHFFSSYGNLICNSNRANKNPSPVRPAPPPTCNGKWSVLIWNSPIKMLRMYIRCLDRTSTLKLRGHMTQLFLRFIWWHFTLTNITNTSLCLSVFEVCISSNTSQPLWTDKQLTVKAVRLFSNRVYCCMQPS